MINENNLDIIKNKLAYIKSIFKPGYEILLKGNYGAPDSIGICESEVYRIDYTSKLTGKPLSRHFVNLRVSNEYESAVIRADIYSLFPIARIDNRMVIRKFGGYYGYGNYVDGTFYIDLENGTTIRACGNDAYSPYVIWTLMVARGTHNIKNGNGRLSKCAKYLNVTIDPKFLSLQHFSEWIFNNLEENNFRFGYQIDKDLFSDSNNKMYSPDTCVFLPSFINTNLIDMDKRKFLPYDYKKMRIRVNNSCVYVRGSSDQNINNKIGRTLRWYKYNYIAKLYYRYNLINKRIYNKLLEVRDGFIIEDDNKLVPIKRKTINKIKNQILLKVQDDIKLYPKIVKMYHKYND